MKSFLAASAAALAFALSATTAGATDYAKPEAKYITVKTPVVTYQPVTHYVPVTTYKAVTTQQKVVTYKEEQRKVYVAPAPKVVYQPVYRPVYVQRHYGHAHGYGHRAW